MQSILDWGIEVVLWLQQFSPALDQTFILFSFTGSETFFLLLLPLIAWCISPRVGVRLMILVLLNTYANAMAKILFAQPRPFDYSPRVLKIEAATGGGLPSGHTQSAVVFWGYLYRIHKKKWLWILAAVLILFVPLSRVYLGAHFPTDLIGGYILGIIMLTLFVKLEQPFIDWFQKLQISRQLGYAISPPAVMVFLTPAIDPVIISIVGVLTGSFVGIIFERRYLNYDIPSFLWKKIARYSVGILVLLLIYVGLKQLFLGFEPVPVYRYVRYTLVGFHFTFFAPWLFKKLNLI